MLSDNKKGDASITFKILVLGLGVSFASTLRIDLSRHSRLVIRVESRETKMHPFGSPIQMIHVGNGYRPEEILVGRSAKEESFLEVLSWTKELVVLHYIVSY